MARSKNVVVAQSGGPTPVINSSLLGVIDACRDLPQSFGTVYAGYHGIEGVLREELLDLSAQDPAELAFLRTTPAAGSIGTCRYKLRAGQDEDLERIVARRARVLGVEIEADACTEIARRSRGTPRIANRLLRMPMPNAVPSISRPSARA